MNLVALGFLDVSQFAATYVQKHRTRPHCFLRERTAANPEFHNTALANEWKSAKALLTRIRNAAAPFTGGSPAELGQAHIEVLAPGESTPWETDESDYRREYHELRICIIPSPGAWTYCGGESMVIPWGQIVAVNRAALCSDVNFGPIARSHLVIGIRRPQPLSIVGED